MNSLYTKDISVMIFDCVFYGFCAIDREIWMKLAKTCFIRICPVTISNEEMRIYNNEFMQFQRL